MFHVEHCTGFTVLIVIYGHRRPLHTSETPCFSRLVAAQCDSISTTPSSPSMSQRQRTGVSALHNPPRYNPNGLAPIMVFYLGRVSCLRGASEFRCFDLILWMFTVIVLHSILLLSPPY